MNRFLKLTKLNGEDVVVGTNNISLIERVEDGAGTSILFNFARNKDLYPKKVIVQESLGSICDILDL